MLRWLRRLAAPVVAIALLGLAPPARAVTLADLIAGGTIQQGDKLFSDFSYLPTGDMPSAAAITVTGVTIAGNYGIRFSGGFVDNLGGGTSDALIGYSVEVTDPNFLITDAHLYSNLDPASGIGGGTITEHFLAVNPPAPPVTPVQITNFNFVPGGSQLEDGTVFQPPGQGYKKISVTKDILLNAIAGPSLFVSLSQVDQTFSQTAVVPLPGAALAGMGLMSLIGFKKRQSRQLEA
jgi:hypothetical protein